MVAPDLAEDALIESLETTARAGRRVVINWHFCIVRLRLVIVPTPIRTFLNENYVRKPILHSYSFAYFFYQFVSLGNDVL